MINAWMKIKLKLSHYSKLIRKIEHLQGLRFNNNNLSQRTYWKGKRTWIKI